MKKRLLSGAFALVFAFSGCFALGSGQSSALESSSSLEIVGHIHIDKDRDRICDDCGEAWGDSSSSPDTPSKPSHEHTDSDGDGICEECSNPIQVTLDFYSINDLHGKFDDTYANIGVDELTTYLRTAQTQNENTVLLSAGDMWQGSAESNFTKGNIITDWMNDLGFAAMTLGNHEFDWGERYIEANEEMARFPFLAINVYDTDTRQRVDYCDASVMLERSGAKIGIIGAIGDCYNDIAVEQTEGVYFKTGVELTALVKAESKRLRAAGADMIVYVLHDSENEDYSHYDESLSNGFVDLVFEGHTHQVVKTQDTYGVWHLQAGGDNADGISYAQVMIDTVTDEVSVSTAKTVYKSTYQNKADDPVVDALLVKYADKLEKVNEVLGYNDSDKNSSALANLAAKAMYLAGEERWGADSKYAGKIVLGGGFVSVRSPYYLPAGEVTYGDIYTLFTFDNPIVLCKLSGSRLKQQFINTSNSHYYMYYGADGEQIKNNVVNSETYYVIVDTYCANYNYAGMGYLEIVEYYDSAKEIFTRDVLAELIKDGGMSANGNKPTDSVSTSSWSVTSSYGGSSIDDYSTGGYGSYTVSGVSTEYYRAYRPKSASYLMQLLPFVDSVNDGTEGGAFYNTSPLYGIRSIEITYKCAGESAIYTADDRVGISKRYTLDSAASSKTVTIYVDTDNFFRVETETEPLFIQAFKVNYTGQSVSYATGKNDAGIWDIRLNPTAFKGTLVAGQSAVSVPVKVEYVAGRYEVTQTKTYTYYTLEYVEANPSAAQKAAMIAPEDVAAYYAAFERFPANYAVKKGDGNSWSEVEAVFGEDTRYVSQYSRTDGYVQYVPYNSSGLVYYEFDIALDASYGEGNRGVGRVVSFANGWKAAGYDGAPVSVYTDDHYATFQEYLNTGEFGQRFDAERNLTFFEWSNPETIEIA